MADAGPFDCVIDMICFTPEQAQSDVRAFRGRAGHFVFCSTVNVYTKPAVDYPITEDFERKPINDDYGAKKVQCEDIFSEAHARGDFPVTALSGRRTPTARAAGSSTPSAGRRPTSIASARASRSWRMAMAHRCGSRAMWTMWGTRSSPRRAIRRRSARRITSPARSG